MHFVLLKQLINTHMAETRLAAEDRERMTTSTDDMSDSSESSRRHQAVPPIDISQVWVTEQVWGKALCIFWDHMI